MPYLPQSQVNKTFEEFAKKQTEKTAVFAEKSVILNPIKAKSHLASIRLADLEAIEEWARENIKTNTGKGRWCKTCNGSIDGEHHRAWCETYDEALTALLSHLATLKEELKR